MNIWEMCSLFLHFTFLWIHIHVPLFVQRIDVLVKQNKYNEALALALSFYDGRAKAVIGLTASSKNKKEVVSSLVRKRHYWKYSQGMPYYYYYCKPILKCIYWHWIGVDTFSCFRQTVIFFFEIKFIRFLLRRILPKIWKFLL